MIPRKWNLLCLLIVLGCTESSAKYASSQLAKVSDDLSILARIVKGIAIGETVDKEPSKLDSLVGEVLNLGHGVTMDTLANGKMGGLDTDLGAIGTAVEKQCGGRNGCADVAGIVQGIKVLEEIGRKLGEVDKVMDQKSPLKQIIAMKEHFEALIEAGRKANELITELDKLKTAPEDHDSNVVLKGLKNLFENINKSEGDFKAINSLSSVITLTAVRKDVAVADSFGRITIQYGASQKVVEDMKSELSDMKQKLGVLKPLFSQKAVDVINGKLDLLSELIRSQAGMADKRFDLEELLKDMRTTFVKDILGNGQNVEESLSDLLEPIEGFRRKLEPLRNSWQVIEFSDTIRGAAANLKSELEAVGRDMNNPVLNSIASITSPETCFGKMNLATQFNSAGLANSPNVWNDLDTHLDSYRNNGARIPLFAGLVKFQDFAKRLDNIGKTLEEYKTKLKELKDDVQTSDQIKQELNVFKTHIDTIKNSPLIGSLELGRAHINKVVSEIGTWMDNSGIQTALDCLKAQPALTSSALSSVSFASFLNLKSDSYAVKPILSMSSAIKTSLVEWNKIKSSQTPTKPKRAAKKSLQNAEKLSKELSEGVKIIRNLAEVQKKQSEVQKLVVDEAAIDAAAKGVTDPAKKGQIDKIWTDATKKSLKALPDTVNKLEKSIDKSPETISDYQKVFSSAKALSYPNINTKDLESALDTITDPPGIQSTLHSIATLDLQFVDAEKRLTAASGALGPLQKFFDDVIGADEAVGAQKQVGGTAITVTEATSLMNYLVIVFICLFVLALIVIAVFVFLWCKEKKKGDDKKTDKKKPGKGKGVEKGKKGKGSTSKSSVTSATPSVSATPAASTEAVTPAQPVPNAQAQNRNPPVQNAPNPPVAPVAPAGNNQQNGRPGHVAIDMEEVAPGAERDPTTERAPGSSAAVNTTQDDAPGSSVAPSVQPSESNAPEDKDKEEREESRKSKKTKKKKAKKEIFMKEQQEDDTLECVLSIGKSKREK